MFFLHFIRGLTIHGFREVKIEMNLSAVTLPKIGGLETFKGFALAAPIAGILAWLVVIGFIIWPKFGAIGELKSSNVDLESRAASLEAKVGVLSTLDSNVLEKQLAASEALLPSQKDVFVLIRQIENSASATGILLDKIDVVPGSINESESGTSEILSAPPSNAVSGLDANLIPNSPKVQVRLSITSSYSSLLNFLSKMYSDARVINIEDLAVSSSGSGESEVRSAFSIDAFWQPLPVDLGSIEKPVQGLSDAEVQLLSNVEQKGVSSEATAPEVPLGRPDLFAPF